MPVVSRQDSNTSKPKAIAANTTMPNWPERYKALMAVTVWSIVAFW